MRFTLITFALVFAANTANAAPRTARSTHREQVQASKLLDRVESVRGTLAHRIDAAAGTEVARLEMLEDELSAAYWNLSKSLDGAWGMCDEACPPPAEFRANVKAAQKKINRLLLAAG